MINSSLAFALSFGKNSHLYLLRPEKSNFQCFFYFFFPLNLLLKYLSLFALVPGKIPDPVVLAMLKARGGLINTLFMKFVAEFSTALRKISALLRQSIGLYLSDFLRLFTIYTISELFTFKRSRSSVTR